MTKRMTANGRTAAVDREAGKTISDALESAEDMKRSGADFGEPRFLDVLAIASDALNIRPPLWASSIFGLPYTWIPPYGRFSEFKILNLWRLGRTIKYLVNVIIPSIPRTPPPFGPPLLNNLFWKPSVILQRPDHNNNYTTFADEAWFFLNGIMTDDSVAQVNAAYISYLFHRPLTLIQNSTDSFVIDMLQCMIGKEWAQMTEPVIKAFPVIYDALKSPQKRKVIVIAHSQGTIIIANVLRLLYALVGPPTEEALEALTAEAEYAGPEFVYPEQFPIDLNDFEQIEEQELAKLEIYSFATCANVFTYFKTGEGERPLPWIEHFGNEFDIVARLGMLAPNSKAREIQIEGPRYMRQNAWGHFLNEHYLSGIEEKQKKGRKHGGAGTAEPFELVNPASLAVQVGYGPRLYEYINGGSLKT
ncbi:MAG: hypothetical protein ACK2T4_08900 [Candidatus Promineifilaceae bacterium]|jgi:hypothetical protein